MAAETAHDERARRRLSLEQVAEIAGISRSHLQALEAGAPVSPETYARVAVALGLRPELRLVDPRRHGGSQRPDQDIVHAAMGELEVRRLRSFGLRVAVDEPYQHYQFAGRADVLAWDLERRVLLHIENRTRFPDLQEAAGSYNAKRRYLAEELAARLGLERVGWASVTHAVVALWSAEVLHVVRLRTETFNAVCPDSATTVLDWWDGKVPSASGETRGPAGVVSTFLLMDPSPGVRERYRFASLEDALRVRPRFRDYGDAAARLRR